MSRKKLLAVMTAMAVTSCNFSMPSTMVQAAPTATVSTAPAATSTVTVSTDPTAMVSTAPAADETTNATPVILTSGDTYVASVQFSETGISFADADGNTI